MTTPPILSWVRWARAGSAGKPARSTPRFACAWLLALALSSWAIPGSARALWQGAPARQVVVFGVVAEPGSTTMDPKIAPVVQAQLRKLLPGHGFRIIKIKGDRVMTNGVVKCDLGEGYIATAKLTNPLDANGKVQMHFDLKQAGMSTFQTIVATPPDQFNFFDKALPNGNRLLVGVGAR